MPGPAGTDFLAAIDEVPAQAAAQPLVAMCNGNPWWRCHWRLVADFAEIIRGVPVRHLMHDGRSAVHLSLAGLRLGTDGLLVYDGSQEQLG
jgi:hypothetical protein